MALIGWLYLEGVLLTAILQLYYAKDDMAATYRAGTVPVRESRTWRAATALGVGVIWPLMVPVLLISLLFREPHG